MLHLCEAELDYVTFMRVRDWKRHIFVTPILILLHLCETKEEVPNTFNSVWLLHHLWLGCKCKFSDETPKKIWPTCWKNLWRASARGRQGPKASSNRGSCSIFIGMSTCLDEIQMWFLDLQNFVNVIRYHQPLSQSLHSRSVHLYQCPSSSMSCQSGPR